MVFLNSQAARGISGVTLIIDGGYMMSSLAGAYEPGTPVAQFLFGRMGSAADLAAQFAEGE